MRSSFFAATARGVGGAGYDVTSRDGRTIESQGARQRLAHRRDLEGVIQVRSQIEMYLGLSLVRGERSQSAQRPTGVIPAIWAMRSSSAGQA
jgi:hypothetical protein